MEPPSGRLPHSLSPISVVSPRSNIALSGIQENPTTHPVEEEVSHVEAPRNSASKGPSSSSETPGDGVTIDDLTWGETLLGSVEESVGYELDTLVIPEPAEGGEKKLAALESSPSKKYEGWQKLKKELSHNVALKSEINLHRSLFGMHVTGTVGEMPIKALTKALYSRRFIIMPDNEVRPYWDAWQLLILPYLAFSVPVRVGFSVPATGVWFILDFLIDLYFLADLVVCALSAYHDHDHMLVTQPRRVIAHYLRGWFLIDIASLLPVGYITRVLNGTFACSFEIPTPSDCSVGANMTGSYLKMIKMLRLVRLIKLARLLKFGLLYEKYQDHLVDLQPVLGTATIAVCLLLCAHVIGCLFYFFSDEEWMVGWERQQPLSTWLDDEFGAGDPPLHVRYTAVLYWAVTTMTTVGFGDIVATTVTERVWAIIACVSGSVFFSYMVANVVKELEVAFNAQVAFNQKMLNVRGFVLDMKLDKATRTKVLHYFRTQNIKPYDEKALLFELPFELRTTILNTLYKELIESVPLFTSGDEVFITELCSHVVPVSMPKGVFVYRAGEAAKDMFIVSAGSVQVTDFKGKQVLAVLGKGSYFGEGSCFGEMRRLDTVRCGTSVQLLGIRREELLEVLEMFPAVKSQMETIHHKRAKEFALRLDKTTKDTANFGRAVRTSVLFNTSMTNRDNQLRSASERSPRYHRQDSIQEEPLASQTSNLSNRSWVEGRHSPRPSGKGPLPSSDLANELVDKFDRRADAIDSNVSALNERVDSLQEQLASQQKLLEELVTLCRK